MYSTGRKGFKGQAETSEGTSPLPFRPLLFPLQPEWSGSTKCWGGTPQAEKRIWSCLGVTWICCSEAEILDTWERLQVWSMCGAAWRGWDPGKAGASGWKCTLLVELASDNKVPCKWDTTLQSAEIPPENKGRRETSGGFASGSAFLFPPHFPHMWCHVISF